ncbi:hypothetical protein C2845_PM16G24690 [Panicum miliaceum]|uniref:Uncharacterized protein n=1 Tax=Panicum miliaceum TaxID=4540 RepID=A0A3L6PTM4_PANMI|nr:hypothetical protein C2845_PM16G24690 [Panicum miliaceum]
MAAAAATRAGRSGAPGTGSGASGGGSTRCDIGAALSRARQGVARWRTSLQLSSSHHEAGASTATRRLRSGPATVRGGARGRRRGDVRCDAADPMRGGGRVGHGGEAPCRVRSHPGLGRRGLAAATAGHGQRLARSDEARGGGPVEAACKECGACCGSGHPYPLQLARCITGGRRRRREARWQQRGDGPRS